MIGYIKHGGWRAAWRRKTVAGLLLAPTGKAILSCMFDVFGNVIDRQADLSEGLANGQSA